MLKDGCIFPRYLCYLLEQHTTRMKFGQQLYWIYT